MSAPLFRNAPAVEADEADVDMADASNQRAELMSGIEVVSEDDEDDEDEGVISIPVYLSRSSVYGSKQALTLFQYPNYPSGDSVPMPPSAAERNLSLAARWRPRANWVEVDVPLDTRPKVYNPEAGQVMGANATPSSAPKKGKVKKEADSDDETVFFAGASTSIPNRRGKLLDKIRLQSLQVPNATRYFVGVMHQGGLHLSSLDSVQQLRPSLHHLDLNDAAERGSGEPSTSSMSAKGRSITVSVREQAADSRGASFTAPGAPSRDQILAPLLEAEQEPWTDLKWNAEKTPAAQEALKTRLLAKDTARLACTALPSDYF